MAQTLTAHLLRLFRTRSVVHWKKNPISADTNVSEIISGVSFYIDNGMLCELIRIASMRRFL